MTLTRSSPQAASSGPGLAVPQFLEHCKLLVNEDSFACMFDRLVAGCGEIVSC